MPIRLEGQSQEQRDLVWAIAAVIRKSYPVSALAWSDASGDGQCGLSIVFDAEGAAQALVDAGYGLAKIREEHPK